MMPCFPRRKLIRLQRVPLLVKLVSHPRLGANAPDASSGAPWRCCSLLFFNNVTHNNNSFKQNHLASSVYVYV